jgi:hypothetical protein
MSKNRNRKKLDKANSGREYHILWSNLHYPPYWDDGVYFYPKYRSGFNNPNKRILKYQQRMYKSWKYNRLKQWKQ